MIEVFVGGQICIHSRRQVGAHSQNATPTTMCIVAHKFTTLSCRLVERQLSDALKSTQKCPKTLQKRDLKFFIAAMLKIQICVPAYRTIETKRSKIKTPGTSKRLEISSQ